MSDLDPRSLFTRDTSPFPLLTGAGARRVFLDERGAATAEYAIATMAAVAFAGLLVVIQRAQVTKFASTAVRFGGKADARGMFGLCRCPDRRTPLDTRGTFAANTEKPGGRWSTAEKATSWLGAAARGATRRTSVQATSHRSTFPASSSCSLRAAATVRTRGS